MICSNDEADKDAIKGDEEEDKEKDEVVLLVEGGGGDGLNTTVRKWLDAVVSMAIFLLRLDDCVCYWRIACCNWCLILYCCCVLLFVLFVCQVVCVVCLCCLVDLFVFSFPVVEFGKTASCTSRQCGKI